MQYVCLPFCCKCMLAKTLFYVLVPRLSALPRLLNTYPAAKAHPPGFAALFYFNSLGSAESLGTRTTHVHSSSYYNLAEH